jgi:hypothetical protein
MVRPGAHGRRSRGPAQLLTGEANRLALTRLEREVLDCLQAMPAEPLQQLAQRCGCNLVALEKAARGLLAKGWQVGDDGAGQLALLEPRRRPRQCATPGCSNGLAQLNSGLYCYPCLVAQREAERRRLCDDLP